MMILKNRIKQSKTLSVHKERMEFIYEYFTPVIIWFSLWILFELFFSNIAKTNNQKLFTSTVMLFTGIFFVHNKIHILNFVYKRY
jgi:hypothetical protein